MENILNITLNKINQATKSKLAWEQSNLWEIIDSNLHGVNVMNVYIKKNTTQK